MTQVTQSPTESTTGLASQPPVAKLPADDSCKKLNIERTAPDLCTRPPCVLRCCCLSAPADKPACLDLLIKAEAETINRGEQAKKFKSDLEALLGKLKGATLDYTVDSYKDLKTRWKTEDEAIVCLIRSIECALPCWWCVIECEICPLVNAIHGLELDLSGEYRLAGETAPAPEAKPPCMKGRYDLRYWWWREKIRRQALFDHVANVMKSWETPFKTIDGILKANGEIIKTITGALNIDQKKEVGKYLFDLVRLVRQHMAIAPPAAQMSTGIEKRYVEVCCCDTSPELHSCCGVVIRLPTVLDRVIGALPYLIEPALYPELVCCLATNVYEPAKKSAVDADARYTVLDGEVKAMEAAIAAQIGSLPADAKIRLNKTIDCADYKPKTGEQECCGNATPASGDDPSAGTNDPGPTVPAQTAPVQTGYAQTPPQTPPAQTGYAQTPPEQQPPPAHAPCAQTQPVQPPPAQTGYAQTPPEQQPPPAQAPCAQTQPVPAPPAQTTYVQPQPVQQPPAQAPCTETQLVQAPPAQPAPQAPNAAQTAPAPQPPGPAQSI
jgi:hypothetical protein